MHKNKRTIQRGIYEKRVLRKMAVSGHNAGQDEWEQTCCTRIDSGEPICLPPSVGEDVWSTASSGNFAVCSHPLNFQLFTRKCRRRRPGILPCRGVDSTGGRTPHRPSNPPTEQPDKRERDQDRERQSYNQGYADKYDWD
jgi:hypothetical protein